MKIENKENRKPRNVLSVSADSKTIKGQKRGFLTGILYLTPDSTLCPGSSKGCMSSCLVSAGRGSFSNVKEARRNKTKLFKEDRNYFMRSLIWSIKAVIRKSERENMTPVIRLNGTSDIKWETIKLFGLNIFEHFPDIQFYDYTKRLDRIGALRGDYSNYHLTLSMHETNKKELLKAKRVFKTNMAVVFKKVPLKWNGFDVVNGDEDDLRFLDKENVIIGLKAKGRAKKDLSGFVQ